MAAPLSRRTLLAGTAAVGAAAGLSRFGAGSGSAAPASMTADVIVVGGGLSGLSAAKTLVDGGSSVIVLEALERAGGRVHNIRSPKLGVTLDAGAEFIGPTQDHIAALAREFDVRTIPTYNQGDSVFWNAGRGSRMSAALPLPVQAETLQAGAGLARAQLDALAGFPVGEPWKHPNARYLDSITWGQYSAQVATTPTARTLMQVAMSAPLSVRPDEVSALYFLNYIAASGDENNPGTLIRLLSTDDGAQERLFEGGAALIPLRMARALGSRVVYNAPVRSIDWSGGTVTVSSDAGTYRARRVIVAMSPAISDQIDYRPGLPAGRQGIHRGYHMGAICKFAAVYRRPFWRDKGLSGQVYGNGRPIDVTFESYAENRHILMGFISADAMRRLDPAPERQIVSECIENFVDYFGTEARQFVDYAFHKWDVEPWSRGGPVAVSSPGTLTRFGPALRAPVGPIHWAGTETSDYWTGYMDGAVRSGARAAREILGARR
ncbi:flavin monoamine oxidase family protein [Gordonia soli]|uniref:Putative flavin-containing amine oxidase n=1 Tax=Gordonia soli NBRC 108243 TaxID=1223545 RepID=M0QKK5_9ACTN|nr:FAD-dependent oxidoreductase [Gordonia soli]GAC69093.1 putative flavin-containing amine oxidase [Gordonia soli NBRC 108243]